MTPSTGPQHASGAKLPLWATIGLSYSSYFENFADVLRASWLWLLVAAVMMGGMGWLEATWLSGVLSAVQHGVAAQVIAARPLALSAAIYLANLTQIIAFASIAVAWHRRIILNERPTLSGSNILTRSFWRYLLIGIAVVVTAIGPVLAVMLVLFTWFFGLNAGVSRLPPGGAVLVIPLMALLYAIGTAVLFHLLLLFPARATGDVDLSFKQAWHRMSGSTWRAFWGLLACTLPLPLAVQLLSVLVVGFPDLRNLMDPGFAPRFAAMGAIGMVLYLLAAPIGVGFLSYAYRYLVRAEPLTRSRWES